MWAFGRRDEVSPTHQKGSHFVKKTSPSKRNNKFWKSGGKGKSGRSNEKGGNLPMDEMNVDETKNGIEVSFDVVNQVLETREDYDISSRAPVISIKEHLRQRLRVHRTQFSTAYPALNPQPNVSLDKWRPKDHRLPLLGISAADMAFDDVLNLLQQAKVTDEFNAVSHEIQAMDAEIKSLEKDRATLENSHRTNGVRRLSNPSFSASSPGRTRPVDWDVRKLLEDSMSSTLVALDDRRRLEQMRGNCLTIHFTNDRAKEVFMAKCNAKMPVVKGNKRRAPGETTTLGPHNCRPGGAAVSLRHVTLMSNNNGSHFGMFLSRDTGKAHVWGRLPPKLYRRMQEDGDTTETGDIVYLSTGPHGSYFAQFRSGECWWGSAVEDREFHAILQSWDVYRVVFGRIESFVDDQGNKKVTNSWIILGRDGRAAWKNIPSRLQHRLESRLATWASPAEIALGPGDSYFVRFLDGVVDYCLPAQIAGVCEYIERHGGSITDIVLHPDISDDYIIRHTEMR